jgi:lipoprotein NlpI
MIRLGFASAMLCAFAASTSLCATPKGAPAAPATGIFIPEIVSRCLMGDHHVRGPVVNCTLAIEAPGLSPEQRAIVYNARGEAHCRRGEYDLAVADQTKAVEFVPAFPQAYADRAGCYGAMGRQDMAVADLGAAIALEPRFASYYEERAMAENFMGRHDAALVDFDAALREMPELNTALDEKAKTLFDLGRYDEAAKLFTQAIPAFPNDPLPLLWLHISRLRAHQPDAEEFAKGVRAREIEGWQKPLFDFFLGKMTLEQVRQAVEEGDDPDYPRCLAVLFGAEAALAKGETDAAKSLVVEGMNPCASFANAKLTLLAELKRLYPSAARLPG